MNPGELRSRIRLQYKTTISDIGTGKPKETWIDFGTTPDNPDVQIPRWAKWQWLHGSEFWQAAAVESKAEAQATIRYIKGITPDMRVIYKEDTYEILPPIDNILEQNQYITFKVYKLEDG